MRCCVQIKPGSHGFPAAVGHLPVGASGLTGSVHAVVVMLASGDEMHMTREPLLYSYQGCFIIKHQINSYVFTLDMDTMR